MEKILENTEILTAEQVVVGELSLANKCSPASLSVTIPFSFVLFNTPNTLLKGTRDTTHISKKAPYLHVRTSHPGQRYFASLQ